MSEAISICFDVLATALAKQQDSVIAAEISFHLKTSDWNPIDLMPRMRRMPLPERAWRWYMDEKPILELSAPKTHTAPDGTLMASFTYKTFRND